jgi:phage/plasmid-associated DNA primase
LPATLYRDWQAYADANGEAAGTANSFGKKMSKRGLAAKVSNGVRAHRGVELKPCPGGYDAD